MRIFAAIRPPETVVTHLRNALDLVGLPRQLRPTLAEQWHLTTRFYGEIPDGAVTDVASELATQLVGFDPLTLELRGAGSFAGNNLWIGVGGEVARLQRLMDQLSDEAKPKSRAHLTVARNTDRRYQPSQLVRALASYQGPSWVADEVELVESRLGQGKGGHPHHLVVETVKLAATRG